MHGHVFSAASTGSGHHDAVGHGVAHREACFWLVENALLDRQARQTNCGRRRCLVALNILPGRGLALHGRGVDKLRLTLSDVLLRDGVRRGAFGLVVRREGVFFTDDVGACFSEHRVVDLDVGNSHVAGVTYREHVVDLVASGAVVVTVFAPSFLDQLELAVNSSWNDLGRVRLLEGLRLSRCRARHSLSGHRVLQRLTRIDVLLRHPVLGFAVEGLACLQRELLVIRVDEVAVNVAVELKRVFTFNPGALERDVVQVRFTRVL